jgi:Site-specific recombinases, DNA invertase Pin homologs
MANEYGYIRVSAKDQNSDRQYDAMKKIGLPLKSIYTDMRSGKNFERPRYKQLMRKLNQGDTLYVKAIDRLGRNYDEIIEQWRFITKEIQANIVIIDMPLLDTRNKGEDLTGTFIADLVLQILSYVAQTEHENIKLRQAEGIASAKARGVHLGRPLKQLPLDFPDIVSSWRAKKITLKEALTTLDVSRSYFYEKVKNLNL